MRVFLLLGILTLCGCENSLYMRAKRGDVAAQQMLGAGILRIHGDFQNSMARQREADARIYEAQARQRPYRYEPIRYGPERVELARDGLGNWTGTDRKGTTYIFKPRGY